MKHLVPTGTPSAARSTKSLSRRSRRRRVLVLAVAPIVVMTLLGGPAGLVWAALAPRPELVLTSDGAVYADPEPYAVIAADGWFAVVTAVAGAMCGALMYAAARRLLCTRAREVAALLGLTVGGVLAALATWGVGRAAAYAEFQHQVRVAESGTHVLGFLQVHAVGLVVAWPLLAVATFAVLLGVRMWRAQNAHPRQTWSSSCC